MDIESFHRQFKVFFDKTDSSAYPEFLDGEIDIYLNEAKERVIKQRYGKNNIYRAGFEEMQKRTDDLKNLVETRFVNVSEELSHTAVGQKVYRANLSELYTDEAQDNLSTDLYMFYLRSMVETCKSNCCSWSTVKLVQQDDVSSIAVDPFNRPTVSRPIIFFESGDIFIWTAIDATIENFQVTFLKRSIDMNKGTYGQTKVECDLSEHLHKEILQEAIQVALENIGSPRTHTQGPVNVHKTE